MENYEGEGMVREHQCHTANTAGATVELEMIRAGLATCERQLRWRSDTDKVASARRRWDPWSNQGKHRKGGVRAALRVQTIGKPTTPRALPLNVGAAAL
jgi:hypothetical protein